MPAYTQEMANQLYSTLTPEQKAEVDASGGPSVAWFTNAANAGVPSAGRIAGAKEGAAEKGWEEEGGTTLPWKDAAEPEEWIGKRAPTVPEFRKYSNYQHQKYVGGDKNAQDEDYERYSDHIVADKIKGFDFMSGAWKPGHGATPGHHPGGTQDPAMTGQPGGEGGGGPAPPPPPPTTFGNQLGMTGNLMQDMLINQFNTGQNSTYSQGNNLFGLGEDRRVGGEGINADDQGQNKAQTLAGGGLWWGQGDFNKGFDATKVMKDQAGKKKKGGGGRPQEATQGEVPPIEPVTSPDPAAAAAGASPQETQPNVPGYKPGFANMMNGQNWRGNEQRRNGMSDMMFDSYSGGNF